MFLKTYVCDSCFHIQKRYRRSKCEECKSETFICDEWIAPTIQILNRKGYKTSFCCSGHVITIPYHFKEPDKEEVVILYHCWGCYIFFDIPQKELLKIKLPEGYELDKKHRKDPEPRTIRYSGQFAPGSYSEAIGGFHKSMSDLYEWASKLPNYIGCT